MQPNSIQELKRWTKEEYKDIILAFFDKNEYSRGSAEFEAINGDKKGFYWNTNYRRSSERM